jgi:hypothetical protein
MKLSFVTIVGALYLSSSAAKVCMVLLLTSETSCHMLIVTDTVSFVE